MISISFLCLVTVARSSSTELDKGHEGIHPCFLPDPWKKAPCGVSSTCFVDAVTRLREFSSVPRLLRFPYVNDEHRQMPFLYLWGDTVIFILSPLTW